jgi:tRNA modification GTPase
MSDTICAISTPFGVGGLAVIRVSGEQAVSRVGCFLSKTVRNTGYRVPGAGYLTPNQAQFCEFRDNDVLIDEVVVTYFKAPRSYTGEDIVEIACHGSSYVQQKILQLLIANGCRLATAGEFTQRAFLNGKMDLSQAEAVADLIHAQSEGSHRLAIEQLRGGFSDKIKQLRQELIDFSALLELELDFSEEDVEFADRTKLVDLLQRIKAEIQTLADSFKLGNALKNGIPVAIVGKPNVGKSTLLNALLNEEKAIVSDIPGTTRDTIEDTLNINGTMFRFIDTAGLRESTDTIESIGIERTRKAIEKAQIVMTIREVGHDDTMDYGDLQEKQVIRIVNKIDGTDYKSAPADVIGEIPISAKNNIGLDKLIERLIDFANKQQVSDRTLVSNLRHYEALNRALTFITNSERALEDGVPTDLVAIDIRSALYHLGEITGQISTDDVLGAIFSRFCIGK